MNVNVLEGQKFPSVFDGNQTIYKAADESKGAKEEEIVINNTTPLKFEETVSKMLTTSNKLSMAINEVMKTLFDDWHGCEIKIDTTNNMIITNLVFKAIAGDNYTHRAFMPITQEEVKSTNSMINKFISVNAAASHTETMKLTAYGTRMLHSIMMPNIKNSMAPNDSNKLSKFVSETSEKVGFSGVNNIYSVITGINIIELIKVVYGRSENKSGITYKITPIRSLTPAFPMNVGPVNWIVEIEKMTYTAYENAMREIGGVPMPGTLNVVTGTISGAK